MTRVAITNYCDTSDRSRVVHIGNLDLYFSYETVIAFRSERTGFVIRQNDWSMTTGKHLNAINSDHSIRISSVDFERELEDCLDFYNLSDVRIAA